MPMSIPPKAPPVYRPHQSANPSVQLKPANTFRTETRTAPPVYRPQNGTNLPAQPKTNPSRQEIRPAPAVYRPQQAGKPGAQLKPTLRFTAVTRPSHVGDKFPQKSASPILGNSLQQHASSKPKTRTLPAVSPLTHKNASIQRETTLNWDQYTYQEDEVIETVRHKRSGNPGGNHFVPHHFISDTIIDIIWKLTRKKAASILEQLTASVGNGVVAGGFTTKRSYDNFVDSCIHAVSDQTDNRWTGKSHGDARGTKLDPPRKKADKEDAAEYGTRFTKAIKAAYMAQDEMPPLSVQSMLKQISKLSKTWWLPPK